MFGGLAVKQHRTSICESRDRTLNMQQLLLVRVRHGDLQLHVVLTTAVNTFTRLLP
jgi:hypothetical protein